MTLSNSNPTEGRAKLVAALTGLMSTKQNAREILRGKLGRYNESGQQELHVLNDPDRVWVQLFGVESEPVRALNDMTSVQWEMPVLVERDPLMPSYYRVIGRDTAKYPNWSGFPQANKHGTQHSFSDVTAASRDIVWVYRRQMVQPLLPRPNNPVGMTIYVEPDFYFWKGEFKFTNGGASPDLTSYKPAGALAKYVTISLVGADGSLSVTDGTTFSLVTPPVNQITYIPEPDLNVAIPLAAVLLTSGTSVISWSEIFDLRVMISSGGSSIPVFTQGSVPFADASGILTEDNAKLFWDNTNKTLQIGTNNLPVPGNPFYKLMVVADGGSPGMYSFAFSDATYYFPHHFGRKARGSQASPTAVQLDDIFMEIAGSGHDGTSLAGAGAIVIRAAENFVPGSTGTKIDFYIEPVGTTDFTKAMVLDKGLAVSQMVWTDTNYALVSRALTDIIDNVTIIESGGVLSAVGLSGSGSAGAVTFWQAPTVLTANAPEFFWDDTNKTLAIGANPTAVGSTSAKLILQRDVGAAVESSLFYNMLYGDQPGSSPGFIQGRSRGSYASPTALLSGDTLGYISFFGRRSPTQWSGSASIVAKALENFAVGAAGIRLDVNVVPVGTLSAVKAFGVVKALDVSKLVVTDANGDLDTLDLSAVGNVTKRRVFFFSGG